MSVFAVAEKFVSINGESVRVGEPAVFIRFRGCNLNCSYCDTGWANSTSANAEMLSTDELIAYVGETGITNVTLTGGEPLLRENIYELIEALMEDGKRVEIETNGSIFIGKLSEKTFRPVFTLDYKLPGSGCEDSMLTENYKFLQKDDAVKFVSGSTEDLERAKEIIERYGLTEKCRVYISPVFGKIDPADIVDFMIKNKMNDARLQLQLHKFIWDPDKRGV